MSVLLVCSALNKKAKPLEKLFREKGIDVVHKWIGSKDWPKVPNDLSGIVLLTAESRLGVLETLLETRKRTRGYTVPIVLVPDDFNREIQAKYLTAGATQVCSPDETDERIVAEVQSSQSSGSVSDLAKIRLTLLQPFSAAMLEAMEIMGGITASVNEIYRKIDYSMRGDISGLIYLLGKTERMLAVTFPMETAKNISLKVLDGVIDNPDMEVISDCVGEIVNIIAGQVKGRFVHTKYEFDISTPSIISGTSHEIRHRSDLPCYVITFDSEIGSFALQLCVRVSDEETGNKS